MFLGMKGLGHVRPVSDGAELYNLVRGMRAANPMMSATGLVNPTVLSSSLGDHLWYAAYTSANHEKRVAEQFARRSVEYFLPLYLAVRRWKDRRVQLHRPLFPGYVFVRLASQDRLRVLQVPGVAKLVGFRGTPTALPEVEIEALRISLLSGVRAEPHRYLTAGRRVKVRSGPLAGLEGILVRKKNSARFVISLDLIMRSVAVEIAGSEVEPV
jgi:transcriptional antiterminator NusG